MLEKKVLFEWKTHKWNNVIRMNNTNQWIDIGINNTNIE